MEPDLDEPQVAVNKRLVPNSQPVLNERSFSAVICKSDESPLPLKSGHNWIPVCSCSAQVSIDCFQEALLQLVNHPEYNSTLILRSEILLDSASEANLDTPAEIPRLDTFQVARMIRRRLLPRRPGRDTAIEQYCTFYTDIPVGTILPPEHSSNASCLVLTPILQAEEKMPYYHPVVAHVAFRYNYAESDISLLPDRSSAQLRIEVVPLDQTALPVDPNSRLYRTCLALLESLHRYSWGALTKYKKRVLHDCLIPRDTYQDLYLIMRERHKHLVDQWKEVTDPLKHVFEDIGIATYLMLLWKSTFGNETRACEANRPSSPVGEMTLPTSDKQVWHTWPRPPNGFLDLGCGNGLLTHILIAEGYVGNGIDVRARTSWIHYPGDTQSHLHVYPLDPLSIAFPESTSNEAGSGKLGLEQLRNNYLKSGVFLIANHADELTPWTPVLSALTHASGYLSIPCCSWSFDCKFDRTALSYVPGIDLLKRSSDNLYTGFVQSLNLGGDGNNSSSYSQYRIWLAALSLSCGWEVECDNLRIPSTRNWAIVGRKRIVDSNEERSMSESESAKAIIQKIRERGIFKTRRPEGKAGDH